jgi:hypothetical protein
LGPGVWAFAHLGAIWSHSSAGIGYGEGQPTIRAVRILAEANRHLDAGVELARLFRSADRRAG